MQSAKRWMAGWLAGAAGVGWAAGPAGGGAVLAREGKPEAVIVVADKAGPADRFAAEELQKYLEKMSGARLEIAAEGSLKEDADLGPGSARVLVGATKATAALRGMLAKKDADAFAVKVERQVAGGFVGGGDQWDDRPGRFYDVVLAGAGDRGTIYAAYDFLERELGCRWLAPGDLWEEIPKRPTVEAPPGSRIEAPGMKYRGDYSLDYWDWGWKQKINVSRRVRLPLPWMSAYHRDAPEKPAAVRGWLGVHDAPNILLGVSQEHPEWFALSGQGARALWKVRGDKGAQLCFSNPETADLLAERLSQLLRERPDLELVEIGCSDGLPKNYCRCPRCLEWDAQGSPDRQGGTRGGHTHRWLALVNAVAERLAESDPGKFLVASAYSSYQEPPDPAVIKPATNVIVLYWTWAGCRVHGFEHGDIEDEARLPEMEGHVRHRQWFEGWRDITPAGLMVAEYVQRSSMDGIAGANPGRYVADVRFLRRNGGVGYLAFDTPAPWANLVVNRYAIAKAMWNPDLDAVALVRDFCDHAFRAASADMQRYIQTIENAMRTSGCAHSLCISWVKPETMAALRGHLAAAQTAAAGDETVMARLRPFEWQCGYTELAGPAITAWLRWLRGQRDPALLREAIRLGEAALAYRDAIRKQHPNEPFPIGWRMDGYVGRNGSWHALLAEMEPQVPAGTRDKP